MAVVLKDMYGSAKACVICHDSRSDQFLFPLGPEQGRNQDFYDVSCSTTVNLFVFVLSRALCGDVHAEAVQM